MLLKATEIGLGGICIAAFDKEAVAEALNLSIEPALIIAIGRSAEKIELVDIAAEEPHAYYRSGGVHYVPKVRLDDLMLK